MIRLELASAKDVPRLLCIMLNVASGLMNIIDSADEMKFAIDTHMVLKIVDGQEIVGLIIYVVRSLDHVHVTHFAVEPQFQRRGIGTTAMKSLLQMMQHTRCVSLRTHPENPALRMYLSGGFSVVDGLENTLRDGQPRLYLERHIDA